ncbi:MAG: hypothetical protein HY699_05705 [Deltaproteobacteria bacterium]|nr:hypothetical protein [Deltaproteobacteria bacterium]
MKRTPTWIIAVAFALLARTVAADAPNLLNYQGRLTDPSGTPKNGTFTMQFAVYDAESGGNQLPTGSPWSETQSVTVTNGVFNVLLGSVTALPTDLFQGGPLDASGPLRFLQVTVSGEALAPRKRIASAAYAIATPDTPAPASGAWTHVATATFPGGITQVEMDVPSEANLFMLVIERLQGQQQDLYVRFVNTSGGIGTHEYIRLRASDNTVDKISQTSIQFPLGANEGQIAGVIYFQRLADWSRHSVTLNVGYLGASGDTFAPGAVYVDSLPIAKVRIFGDTDPFGVVHLYKLRQP